MRLDFPSVATDSSFSQRHRNYVLAPCYVEGTLTGSVQCGEQKLYFACDSCDDLFGAKP
jgi:hypothetical protein